MKGLTKKEIQEELKRLGIHTTSDINSCLREYKWYCSSKKEKDKSACKATIRDIEQEKDSPSNASPFPSLPQQ